MSERFTNNYRILGIRPGASWKELRQAYKSLVNIWHPDRYQQDLAQQELAEEKTKEINESYKELAEYYKKFGALPDIGETTEKSVAEDIAPQDAQDAYAEPQNHDAKAATTESASAQAHTSRRSRRGARILAVVVLAGVVYFSWQILLEDRPDNQPQSKNITQSAVVPPNDDNSSRDVANGEKYFTFGSSLGEVYAIQGVPSRTEQDVWYYGKSKVVFANGKVQRWEENADNPLRTEIDPKIDRNAKKTGVIFFGVGSSKDDVLAVQGAPDRDAGNVWDYGVSRVYFENDHVKGWDELPLNPLKVRR